MKQTSLENIRENKKGIAGIVTPDSIRSRNGKSFFSEDTVITAKRKKTEIITLLVCFIIANLLNLYAIIQYKTAFAELLTCLGYVAMATVALYVLWSLIRIIFYAIGNAIKHPKRS
jgi:hypothetical protein